MHVGFNLSKTSIPLLVPFFADPTLAKVDRILHGGSDPWIWAWKTAENLALERWLGLYYFPWIVLATLFPLILAVSDTSTTRISKHLKVYLFCWLFLGGIVATAFSSGGPVFYDRLLGTLRFDALVEKQINFGFSQTPIGRAQDFLWTSYETNNQELGVGISAFPSVHVALATLFALYAWDRSKSLFPLAFGYWIVILFLSVWSGFHYAVDGYVSSIAVWMYWFYLTVCDRRRSSSLQLQT